MSFFAGEMCIFLQSSAIPNDPPFHEHFSLGPAQFVTARVLSDDTPTCEAQ